MTDMPRCRTCKWWDADSELDAICLVMSPTFQGITDNGELDERPRPKPLAAIGGSPIYTPMLYTKADFGCVQHEPREDVE